MEHSPIVEVKQRKCRDVICLILFLLFWIASLGAIFTYKATIGGVNPATFKVDQLMFGKDDLDKMLQRASLLVKPGDQIRRMCGFKAADQPDYLAPDYTGIVTTTAQIQKLCALAKIIQPTIKADCAGLTSSTTVRPFLAELRGLFLDMTDYSQGLKGDSETVCTKGVDCTKIDYKATYVCHRDFLELTGAAGIDVTAYTQLITEVQYLDITGKLALQDMSFLGKLCVKLPVYTGKSTTVRDDMAKFDFFAAIGADICMQNFILQAQQTIGSAAGEVESVLNSNAATQYLMNFMSDSASMMLVELREQWKWLVIATASSVVVAYLVILLIKFIIAIIVWAIIIGLLAGLGFLSFWLIKTGVDLDASNKFNLSIMGQIDEKAVGRADNFKNWGYVVAAVDFVLLLLVTCMMRSIRIAIAVIGAASDAMRKLFAMVLLPFVFVPLLIVHLAWSVAGAYLYNCMTYFNVKYNQFDFVIAIQDPITKVYSNTTDSLGLAIFVMLIFAVIWGVFFLYAALEYLISSLVTQWYFSAEPRKTKGFLRNAGKMMIKSIGTIACSSFIVALVVLIRWLFEYVYKRMNQSGKFVNSKVAQKIAWGVRIALKLLQKFVQYTNRNAQVLATITGNGYCKSAGLAMKFQFTNLKAVIAINVIGDFALFLVKIVVAAVSAVICWVLCRYASDNEAKKAMVVSPTIATFIASYLVAFYIVEILELTIDTIFMAFLYENEFMQKERDAGIASFAPHQLRKLLEDHGSSKEDNPQANRRDTMVEGIQPATEEVEPGTPRRILKKTGAQRV